MNGVTQLDDQLQHISDVARWASIVIKWPNLGAEGDKEARAA